MAVYEFKCKTCSDVWVDVFSMGECPDRLPHSLCCGKKPVRVYSSPRFRFEGGRDEWRDGLCNESERKRQFDLAVQAGADPDGLYFGEPR